MKRYPEKIPRTIEYDFTPHILPANSRTMDYIVPLRAVALPDNVGSGYGCLDP